MTTKTRPNSHIWKHAEQFHNAAETLWNREDGDLNSVALPLIVNYALSAELALKSAEGVTTYGQVIDGIIGAATLGSNVHGHDLAKVFAGLKPSTQSELAAEFLTATGEPLQPVLAKCADYFVRGRYSYESKGAAYDLSAIRMLSEGLLKAVMAHGLKHPNGV